MSVEVEIDMFGCYAKVFTQQRRKEPNEVVVQLGHADGSGGGKTLTPPQMREYHTSIQAAASLVQQSIPSEQAALPDAYATIPTEAAGTTSVNPAEMHGVQPEDDEQG